MVRADEAAKKKPTHIRHKTDGRQYRIDSDGLRDLAIYEYDEQHIIYSDIEDVAVGVRGGNLFLIDECGNVAYLYDYELGYEEATDED